MSVPPSVGDVLGASGAPPTVTSNGKTWKVGYPTGGAKDRLEKLIVADAWENIQAAKLGVPEVDDEMVKSFHTSVRNREYRTGGSLWSAAFSRLDGQVKFYLSLIQEHHPEATAEDVVALMADQPDEFMTAMEIVTPRFFFVVAEAMGLPKDKRAPWATEQAATFLQAFQTARAKLSPPTPSS